MNYRIQQFLINIAFYIIPAVIVIMRHADERVYKRSAFGIFIVFIIVFMYLRKKHKYMKIKENKEIEDDHRKTLTIVYFYTRFAVFYTILVVAIYYIQFNFEQLVTTLILIAISLIIGAILRIDLANRTGK